MKKRGRVALRNKIAAFLNSKPNLGCKVFAGPTPGGLRTHGKRDRFFSRLVTGTGRGGRTICIYPILYRKEHVPRVICEHLRAIEELEGIAGTCESIGDAWDVVIDSPEYPRKRKTFLHNYWLEKEKDHGESRTADDSEE